ncbi:MAG: hypothetical protein JWR21_898 [Herminiimonas sp.]|nr:hypothetical protein [Herminiimonas sp.]MDB5853272.1 hypothetical protein [Herminiimonas sp.]
MAKIKVYPDCEAQVDDEDVPLLSQYRWYLKGQYASTNIKRKPVTMHSLLLSVGDGMVRDHINRDRLDNRKANLRPATMLQNSHNASLRKDNQSGFKGVYWNKQYGRWKAQIRHEKKRVFLGYHDSLIAAAKAYDRAASEFFGAFASLNF